MAWDFLYSVRRTYHGEDNWGDLYMKSADEKQWEWLSYSYELPWKANANGKSIPKQSRVEMGVYELITRSDGRPRSDGGKGWRLQLLNTKHRTAIEIHRAAPNLYIEGCILPVHFNGFQGSQIQKGDPAIRTMSAGLMDKIMSRWNTLLASHRGGGNPTITIAETLPAELITNRGHAHA